jgi:CRP/FNR family transcriptional regulator, dissimilatory nitrate respiration regulator
MPTNPPSVPAALRALCKRVRYAPGQTVFRSGSATHSVYHVESGAVRLLRYGRAGEEVVLHHARAGEFFAEASLDSSRYHCDAVASEPCELLRCPAAALRQLLESDAEFAAQWLALLGRQLRTLRSRVERLSLKSAAERVRHLLVSEGRGPRHDFTVQGSLKDLARHLGLSHEALYRTLAALEREGVIEREGPVLRLLE